MSDRSWDITKSVLPVGTGLILIASLATGIWYAGRLDFRVENLEENQSVLRADYRDLPTRSEYVALKENYEKLDKKLDTIISKLSGQKSTYINGF